MMFSKSADDIESEQTAGKRGASSECSSNMLEDSDSEGVDDSCGQDESAGCSTELCRADWKPGNRS